MKSRLPAEYTAKGANAMMKQAQLMQESMEAIQADCAAREYTAKSGGGMVECTVIGQTEVKAIAIKPEVVDPEDVEMLSDLVAAAVNGALRMARDDYEAEMVKITGGLSLPGIG